MIAQRANDPVESTRRIFAAFTNPSLGREQVEPLLAEIDQLRRTRDDLVEANNRYQQEARDARAEVRSLSESKREWQPMETAPKDGRHIVLAVPSGPFVYSIQGAFMNGEWSNAADIEAEPLCWHPARRIPKEFLPWTDEFKAARAVIAKEAGHAE